jgi:hypothetical protein
MRRTCLSSCARARLAEEDVYQLEIHVKVSTSRVGASLRLLTVELTSEEDLWFHHTM